MAKVDPTPSLIPRTTGTNNTSHDANNISGNSAGHVNVGGPSIQGRTSFKDKSLQAEPTAKRSAEED